MLIKKIFIISTILLLIVSVFFGIYYVAFKSRDALVQDNTTPIEKAPEKSMADVLSEKVTNITSESVLGYTFGPNGDTIRYVDKLSGKIWTMTVRGTNREEIAMQTEGVPTSAQWSSDGDGVVMKYADGSIMTYEISAQKKTVLRSGMDDVQWAHIPGKILYKYYDDGSKERSLNFANADGTNWKKIAELPFRETRFAQVPSSIFAVFWPKGVRDTVTELYQVSTVTGGDAQKIFEGRRGADFMPSPTGERILMSVLNDAGMPTLATIDARGQNYTDLHVPTIVSKAVWARDGVHVYYAQPTDIPQGAVMPDEYFAKKFTTHDTFYKMDVTTGKKERVVDLEAITQQFDATDLRISASGDMLLFINRADGLLYRITL